MRNLEKNIDIEEIKKIEFKDVKLLGKKFNVLFTLNLITIILLLTYATIISLLSMINQFVSGIDFNLANSILSWILIMPSSILQLISLIILTRATIIWFSGDSLAKENIKFDKYKLVIIFNFFFGFSLLPTILGKYMAKRDINAKYFDFDNVSNEKTENETNLNELIKLKKLLDENAITEEEYKKTKEFLMNKKEN